MTEGSGTQRRSIISLGYANDARGGPYLAESDAHAMRELFVRAGHDADLSATGLARASEIEAAISTRILDLSDPDECLVLYIAGHGHTAKGSGYICLPGTPATDVHPGNALSAERLGGILAASKVRSFLLILDCCQSDFLVAGIVDALTHASKFTTRVPQFDVIASSAIDEGARDGGLRTAIEAAVLGISPSTIQPGDGAGTIQRPWPAADAWIRPRDLVTYVNLALNGDQTASHVGGDHPSIPNLLTRGSAERAAYKDRLLFPLAARHDATEFGNALRGDDREESYTFVGRTAEVSALLGWLNDPTPGGAVVVGPAGIGKTSLVAHLALWGREATMAQARHFGALGAETGREPYGLDALVNASGKERQDLFQDLADLLGVEPEADERALLALSRQAGPAGSNRPFVVLVDSIDEADWPEGLADDLGRLVGEGFKILVSIRAGVQNLSRLAFERHAKNPLVIDLERAEQGEGDVRDYVTGRMAEAEVFGSSSRLTIDHIVNTIVNRSSGLFLMAQLATSAVLRHASRGNDVEEIVDELGDLLGYSLDEAVFGLLRWFGEDARRAVDLLTPLSFSRGDGLPRGAVWAELATALSRHDGVYSEHDVTWLIREADWVLSRSSSGERPLYSLFHPAIGDVLRRRTDEYPAEQAICEALLQMVASDGWVGADDYIKRHLVGHAALGGRLKALSEDPGFIVESDPRGLLRALMVAPFEELTGLARVYLKAGAALKGLSSEGRRELLVRVAARDASDLVSVLTGSGSDNYLHRWSARASSPFHRVLAGNQGWTNSVNVRGGVVCALSATGVLQMWERGSGEVLPAVRSRSAIDAATLGGSGDSDVILAFASDGAIDLWQPFRGEPLNRLDVPGDRIHLASFGKGPIRGSWLVGAGDEAAYVWRHPRTADAPEKLLLSGRAVDVDLFQTGDAAHLGVLLEDGTVRLWLIEDTATFEAELGPLPLATTVAFDHRAPDIERSSLLIGGLDGSVEFWDLGQRRDEPTRRFGVKAPVHSVAFTANGSGRIAAIGTEAREVQLIEVEGGRTVMRLPHYGWVRAMSAGESGELITGADDRTVRVWGPFEQEGDALPDPALHHGWVRSVAIVDVDLEPCALSVGDDGSLRRWGMTDGQARISHRISDDGLRAIAELPGGQGAVLAGKDGVVRLWRAGFDDAITVGSHDDWVTSLCVHRDGTGTVATSGSRDGAVKQWRLGPQELQLPTYAGHRSWVRAIVELGNDLAASCDDDGQIHVWSRETGVAHRTFQAHDATVRSMTVIDGPDGRMLASGGYDGCLRLWDPSTGAQRGELKGHDDWVLCLIGIPPDADGRPRLISGSYDGTLKVWSLTSMEPLNVLPMAAAVTDVAWYGDDVIIVGLSDGLLATRLPDAVR